VGDHCFIPRLDNPPTRVQRGVDCGNVLKVRSMTPAKFGRCLFLPFEILIITRLCVHKNQKMILFPSGLPPTKEVCPCSCAQKVLAVSP
jgi:hypothetical protein